MGWRRRTVSGWSETSGPVRCAAAASDGAGPVSRVSLGSQDDGSALRHGLARIARPYRRGTSELQEAAIHLFLLPKGNVQDPLAVVPVGIPRVHVWILQPRAPRPRFM